MNNITPATKEHQIIPVILCGDSGARLWPLSRADFLKQFLVLSGGDSHQSLFQQGLVNAYAQMLTQAEFSVS